MQSTALFVIAVIVIGVLAEGQYYVPRAYYTIDAEGHASPPVPLRRLRRSVAPYPYRNGGISDSNDDLRELLRTKRNSGSEDEGAGKRTDFNLVHYFTNRK